MDYGVRGAFGRRRKNLTSQGEQAKEASILRCGEAVHIDTSRRTVVELRPELEWS